MPRYKRIVSRSGIYHVMCRGLNKQILFGEESDYLKFLNILKEEKTEFEFKIFAYCLMSNHLHLVIFDKKREISNFMKKINEKYALFFNGKYERIGNVFNNRFKSENIEDRKYLLTCIRYVHQNPVKAGICKRIFDYKFTSIHSYKNRRGNYLGLVDNDYILSKIDVKDFLNWNTIDNEDKCLEINDKKLFDSDELNLLKKKYEITSLAEIQNLSKEDKNKITIELLNKNYSIKKISRLTGFCFRKISNIKKGVKEKSINVTYM